MTHLTPFEVLTAINHAQHRLGRKFTPEEIESGGLSGLMIDVDFDFKATVSFVKYEPEFAVLYTVISNKLKLVNRVCAPLLINNLSFQTKTLASDRREKFQEEIKTLSGSLKTFYDQANKEYEGNFIRSSILVLRQVTLQ